MKKNLDTTAKILGLIIAAIVAALYFTGTISGTLGIVLLVLASVLFTTSLINSCLIYTPIGIGTISQKEKYQNIKSMITRKSIAILFFSLPFLSKAQVVVEWSNAPGGVALATDQLNNVYSAEWDYNPGGDISLTKRNAAGNIFWTIAYNNTDSTRHEVATWLETDNQNNCLVAGTIRSGYSTPVNAASLLMKYDSSGNLIWRNVFESSFEGSYTVKIIVDSLDNIYVLGLGMGANGLVTRVKKFNTSGVPVWTYYDTNGIGAPVNIKFTPDNSMLVSARGTSGIINGYLKLDLNGNLIWSKPGITSSTVGDAAGDSFGNTYIINGYNNSGSLLAKYNQSGMLIWSDTNIMAGTKVEVGSDNNVIISGFPNQGTAGAAFTKYNASGTVLWQNLNADGPEVLLLHGQLILDNANNAYLSAGNLFNMAVCKINSDGTYGWVGLVSGSNSAKSFVLASNNTMYIIGTTTAKLSQSLPTPIVNTPSKSEILISPNPFENEIRIVMQDNIGEKKITLFSLNGMIIYENTFWGQVKKIDLKNIESGMYILNIKSPDGNVFNQKIIKK